MWYQFLRQHRPQMEHHCPRHCELFFIISATHFIDVNLFNFFVGPNILFLDLFVFPFCLNDET